jgi:hypothetical protein
LPAPTRTIDRPFRSPKIFSTSSTARAAADVGLAADPLRGREGAVAQARHERARGLGAAGDAVGLLHLAEDLLLAEHHRVEARGDAEEVTDGVGAAALVQVRRRLAGAIGEEPSRGLVRPLARHVDLDPVAGRDDHRLGDARLALQPDDRVAQRVAREGHLLADRDRRALVREPDEDQVHHDAPPSVLRAS